MLQIVRILMCTESEFTYESPLVQMIFHLRSQCTVSTKRPQIHKKINHELIKSNLVSIVVWEFYNSLILFL